MRTRYIAVKAAIRYKKDGILAKSVFFDANNLRLFASLFNCNSNCNSSANHGVVTHTDETHHLYASGAFAIASGWKAFAQKPCHISLFDIFALQNLYPLNTSF